MAQEPVNVTLEVLKQIRDGVSRTNERLDTTNERLDATNERLDAMREELGRRIVESELRTATAITELATTVGDMTAVLRASADLRPRVEACERDIEKLRARIGS